MRKSRDPNDPRYDEFIDWEPGDILEDYPPYTAIEEWLRAGHIEVMDADRRRIRMVRIGQHPRAETAGAGR